MYSNSGLQKSPIPLVFIVFMASQLVYFSCYLTLLYFDKISSDIFTNTCHRDCEWYLSIIFDGYDPVMRSINGGQSNWAFFPLFPLISRALILIFHNKLSVLIFNEILFFFSLLIFYQYGVKYYSKRIAFLAVLLLSFSFINVYIFSFYTESLFLFLSLLTMHLISKQKYFLAGVSCAFISATRMQGAVLVLPLLFNFLMDHQFQMNYRNLGRAFLLASLALSGLWVFMIYMHVHVGDSLAFVHIQNTWGRGGYSWLTPLKALRFFRIGKPIDIFFEILTIPCLYYFYKNKKWNEFIFVSACFLMVFLSQNFNSYARFSVANYGFFIYLAALMRGWWRSLLIVVPSFSIYMVFLCRWLAFPLHAYY